MKSMETKSKLKNKRLKLNIIIGEMNVYFMDTRLKVAKTNHAWEYNFWESVSGVDREQDKNT